MSIEKEAEGLNAFYERRPDEMTVFHADSMDFPAHFHESLEMFYKVFFLGMDREALLAAAAEQEEEDGE